MKTYSFLKSVNKISRNIAKECDQKLILNFNDKQANVDQIIDKENYQNIYPKAFNVDPKFTRTSNNYYDNYVTLNY